jgi:hypothetical protein
MFAKIDSLPYPKGQFPVSYRDQDRITQKGGFQMGGHIIRAFVIMHVIGIVFRNSLIKKGLKILTDRRICIFVQCEGGGSVLNEYLAKTGPELADTGCSPENGGGNEMKTSFLGGKGDGLLVDFHMGSSFNGFVPIFLQK